MTVYSSRTSLRLILQQTRCYLGTRTCERMSGKCHFFPSPARKRTPNHPTCLFLARLAISCSTHAKWMHKKVPHMQTRSTDRRGACFSPALHPHRAFRLVPPGFFSLLLLLLLILLLLLLRTAAHAFSSRFPHHTVRGGTRHGVCVVSNRVRMNFFSVSICLSI